MLLGLLRAEAGTVRLLGGDPWHDAVSLHRRVAYVPGDVTLWPNLTGGQAIDFLARLRGGVDARRRDQLIQRFELDPHKKARTYSKGNRQKVALVAAFSCDAELYILDEPTSGLDPLMERAFEALRREVADRGAAVLLSSHILAEVEKLCDTVTIIRSGSTVRSGGLAELRHLMRTTVNVRTRADANGLHDAAFVHDFSAPTASCVLGEPPRSRPSDGPADRARHRRAVGLSRIAGGHVPARIPGDEPMTAWRPRAPVGRSADRVAEPAAAGAAA